MQMVLIKSLKLPKTRRDQSFFSKLATSNHIGQATRTIFGVDKTQGSFEKICEVVKEEMQQ